MSNFRILALSVLVILLMHIADSDSFLFGLRIPHYPILLFWLYLRVENILIDSNDKSKANNYLQFNFKSFRLNSYLIFFALLIFGAVYTLGIYPKGNLSDLNRGIPYFYFPFLYAMVSVPIQQDLIFGQLYNKINISNPYLKNVILAAFYSLIHIYYPEPLLIVCFTFILGLYWSFCRASSNSILGNILAHALIGILAFSLNLA